MLAAFIPVNSDELMLPPCSLVESSDHSVVEELFQSKWRSSSLYLRVSVGEPDENEKLRRFARKLAPSTNTAVFRGTRVAFLEKQKKGGH